MKIIIEPTEAVQLSFPYRTISVSVPNDDVTCEEALELMRAALIAWGFDSDSLRDLLDE